MHIYPSVTKKTIMVLSLGHWLSGREAKGVVFTTILIVDLGFNPHPGRVVASLDKTLHDDYRCLAASSKQHICVERSQTSAGKLGKQWTPKLVRILPKSLSRDRKIKMH